MRAIRTSIDIDAPPSKVWAVLTDFPAYSSWNSLIPKIEGAPGVGSRLKVTIHPPGKPASRLRPVIEQLEPESLLVWRGAFGFEKLLMGVHRFRLIPMGQGTRFEQAEEFSGVLVGFFGSTLKATELGFNGMNLNLKCRVEGR
jgi:hypothetical protein